MSDPVAEELLKLNHRLLESIAQADWAIYEELCDPSLTAFEPEAKGQLMEGMDFHHFYFRQGSLKGDQHTTICTPRVRVMGDVAVIAYVRLDQHITADGSPATTAMEETRVWQRKEGRWRLVHFHRSPTPG